MAFTDPCSRCRSIPCRCSPPPTFSFQPDRSTTFELPATGPALYYTGDDGVIYRLDFDNDNAHPAMTTRQVMICRALLTAAELALQRTQAAIDAPEPVSL